MSVAPPLGVHLPATLLDGEALVHHIAAIGTVSHNDVCTPVIVVGATLTSCSQLLVPRVSHQQ